ncbi:MAG: hypothetical protein K2G87_02550 [Oscillospiraceae bacterium]|nr:hypothetical protein [Oscillospiraceae bacterium]
MYRDDICRIAVPLYDEVTGRIYFTIQGSLKCCYILNPKTLEYDEYDVSKEEFDEFYEDFDYEW